MYEEIMHKMPHRIYEFIKAVDEVQKMLERKGYGKLNDNLDQLKIALEKAQKEQENIYSAVYDKKDFEMLLPQTYNEIKNWLKNDVIDYPNSCIDFIQRDNNDLINITTDDLELVFDNEFHDCEWLEGFENSIDFVHLCEHYYSKEYGSDFNEYINEQGDFDFERFCKETDFKTDIAEPFSEQLINDHEITERMEQVNKEKDNDKDIDNFINSFSDDKTTTADKTALIKFTDDFER